MRKRIVFLLVVLLLCSLSVGVCGAKAAENYNLRLLEGLDIVCGLSEDKLEKPITKSTFINYVLNIASENKHTDYYDEDVIFNAEQMGIISSAAGVSKNDILSANEAITIAVRILGYELRAKESGGYPAGYMNVAMHLGLLDGVTFDEKVTYSQAIALLGNVIECDYSQYTTNRNGDIVTYDSSVNVLDHYRNIYFVKAVITADDESDLFSDTELGKGFVKVGDEVCYEGDSNAKDLLGHYAHVYLKETKDGVDEVIYADDKAKETFVLEADNIEKVEDDLCMVEYYKDKTSSRVYKLQIASDAAFALNGVSNPGCSEKDFTKAGAIITFVDNDGDNEYDFVNIESYDTMIISGISFSSMKIYNEYTFDESLATLDLSEYDEDKIHIFKNDDEIELSELAKGDILSVFKTPKGTDGRIEIYAKSNQFNGTVESISIIDEENQQVVIDGTTYELSKLYIGANKNNETIARTLKPGISYIFGCDRNGKIIFAKTIQSDDIVYGYVVKMFETQDTGEPEVRFKMFMEDGSWNTYILAEKLKWNGTKMLKSSEVYEMSEITAKIPGLVGIRLNNEGRISVLETPLEYTSDIDIDRLNTIGELTANYRYNGTTFSNYYYMTSQTKVFIIPEDINADESFYEIGTNTSFKSDNSYTIEGYNRDEYYVLDMVVSKRNTDTIQTVGDTLYMVRDVGVKYDDEHGVLPFINVASNTYAGVSLLGEEGAFDGIKEGDLIKIHMNSVGLIDNCSVIYSVSSGIKKTLPTVNERHSASSVVTGLVEKIDVSGGKMLVETAQEMAFMVSASTPVIIYDAQNREVSVGNLNDIEKGDLVNVSLSRSLVNMLAIYKGLK